MKVDEHSTELEAAAALPDELTAAMDSVERVCAALADNPAFSTLESALRAQLPRLFACSPFAAELCERRPELLLQQDLLNQAIAADSAGFQTLRDLVTTGADENQVMAEFRQARNALMLGIVWRDLVAGAEVAATLADLTCLADVCISLALEYADARLVERFGEPLDDQGRRQKLIVLGMGKLGGGELNFSSDIDLILIYPSSGQTNGRRSRDNGEFFKKLAQQLVRLLGKITEDGFVFRVDLRLRPFGDSGPLVMNFDGVEHYYLTQGREWERYAMIKARPMGGDPQDIAELMAMLKPFIYRRYLDYSAIASLRDLKARITAEVSSRGMQNNVKLGPGGIREIEFIGQAFQLVRGGREPTLQTRSIVSVLNEAGKLGLLQPQEVDSLLQAYTFLRRTENYLQMMRDQQVHTLPEAATDRCRLLYAMGYSSWESFRQALDSQLSLVQGLFRSLFQDVPGDDSSIADDPYSQISFSSLDYGPGDSRPVLQAVLESQGFAEAEKMVDLLEALTSGALYRNLSATAQQRVDRIIPLILRSVQKQADSLRAFDGMLKLVRSVAGRSVYLQVLCETPAALDRLARLFGRSSWLADFVSQHPIVIDELLDYRQIEALPEYQTLQQEMAVVIERIKDDELDVQMDSLRQFRQAATLRVAAADLEDRLDLMGVSDRLSWIAEICLQAVSDLVWDQLIKVYGKPSCVIDGKPLFPGFAIVAYGKLGGLELGYGSDLDIVFLHESEGEAQQTSGPRVIENQVFFARLAQKVVNFLNTLTPAGTMYEIDTRLRPNGQSGLLVSGVEAFASYQQNDAWTWEHQALVRARVVVGNQRIRSRFADLRQLILCRRRVAQELCQDVAEMRQKMRRSLGSDASDTFDLKQDAGGIADIEFMVQYLVLSRSADYSELTTDTDNVRILERVGSLGLLQDYSGLIDASSTVGDSAQANQAARQLGMRVANDLREAYLAFRGRVHQRALLDEGARIPVETELQARRDRVVSIWNQLMCPQS